MNRQDFERDRTHLSYWDFGGSGPPMLLLHGLAGYAGECGTVVDGPFTFGDRGFHELKGVPGRWPLFALLR
jgi:hypothetical protein